jgi:hypothetical protein
LRERGGDQVFDFGLATDTFIIGDWNASGQDKIGVYRPGTSTLVFSLDTNGNGVFETGGDQVFNFGLPTDRVLVGKWIPPAPALAADALDPEYDAIALAVAESLAGG